MFPGVVLGVAMIQMALRAPFPLYGSLALLILAFFVRYLPYGMRYSFAGVLQIHRELEEAASVAGGSTLGNLRRIVAPLLTPALLSGWLFVFLISAKELSVAILLAGPQSQMMAVVIFDMWVNGQAGQVAALGLMWTAVMTLVASALYFITRRQTGSAFAA
jgi:iron(III) transport system permease protein